MPQDPDKTLIQESPAKAQDKQSWQLQIDQSKQKVQKLTCLDEKGLMEQVQLVQQSIDAKFAIYDEIQQEFSKLIDNKFVLPSFDATVQKFEQFYLESAKAINECIDQGSRFQ